MQVRSSPGVYNFVGSTSFRSSYISLLGIRLGVNTRFGDRILVVLALGEGAYLESLLISDGVRGR